MRLDLQDIALYRPAHCVVPAGTGNFSAPMLPTISRISVLCNFRCKPIMCVIAVNITSTQCKQRSGLLAQPLIRSVAPVTFGRPAHNGSRLGASLNRRRRTPFGFTAVFAKAQQESAAQAAESKGRNILVAADSSEDSRWALKWVAQELYRPGKLPL